MAVTHDLCGGRPHFPVSPLFRSYSEETTTYHGDEVMVSRSVRQSRRTIAKNRQAELNVRVCLQDPPGAFVKKRPEHAGATVCTWRAARAAACTGGVEKIRHTCRELDFLALVEFPSDQTGVSYGSRCLCLSKHTEIDDPIASRSPRPGSSCARRKENGRASESSEN